MIACVVREGADILNEYDWLVLISGYQVSAHGGNYNNVIPRFHSVPARLHSSAMYFKIVFLIATAVAACLSTDVDFNGKF